MLLRKELPLRHPRGDTHGKHLMPGINREAVLFAYDIFASRHGIAHTEYRKMVKLSI